MTSLHAPARNGHAPSFADALLEAVHPRDAVACWARDCRHFIAVRDQASPLDAGTILGASAMIRTLIARIARHDPDLACELRHEASDPFAGPADEWPDFLDYETFVPTDADHAEAAALLNQGSPGHALDPMPTGLTLAQWLDGQADFYRNLGSAPAEWLSGHIAGLADLVRRVGATDFETFQRRCSTPAEAE